MLKPGGELIVMLYAKWSFNYLVGIGLLRRLGLVALYGLNLHPGATVAMSPWRAEWASATISE